MVDRLSWLHLSDFHFTAGRDPFSQNVVTSALLADVPDRLRPDSRLGFVLISGDVAYSGKSEEYAVAATFFASLAESIGVDQNCFFYIPGNHDVDRNIQPYMYEGVRKTLTSQSQVDRFLANDAERSQLLKRQGAFWEFVEQTAGNRIQRTDDGLGYVASVDVDGLKLSIVALNSSWLCGSDGEEMQLLIGERQVINALTLIQDFPAALVIAMAHHPFELLHEWDQVCCSRRLLQEADFYHRGHLHRPEVLYGANPSNPCVMVAAGSSHANRHYENSYSILDLDLGAGKCAMRTFMYAPCDGRFLETEQHAARIELRGSLGATGVQLSEVISGLVPSAATHALYISGLVLGQIHDIPILIDNQVQFVSPEFALEVTESHAIAPLLGILRLRNLLRLYDEGVELAVRLRGHQASIEACSARLHELSDADPFFADHLSRRGDATTYLSAKPTTEQPHTVGFLQELISLGDWSTLEPLARRHLVNPDRNVSRLARSGLVQCLMRNDEASARAESYELAVGSLKQPDVTCADYCLTAGAAEVNQDNAAAISVLKEGLSRWPGDPSLRNLARRVALRTGSQDLRKALDDGGAKT